MPFTWLDIAFFAVMLLSGLLAMMRGLTREVLSILSWVGAAAAAAAIWFEFPDLHTMVRGYIQPNYLADIVLTITAFVIVLIILSAVTAKLSDRILDSDAGALDRTLGFVFGIGRGLILVVIAFLLFDWLVPRQQHPRWVLEARTLPVINSTAQYIISYLPEETAATLRGGGLNLKKENGTQSTPETPTDPPPADKQKEGGYKGNERRGLNQLVEGAQGTQN
jgi:membrane protein required for colicin V production